MMKSLASTIAVAVALGLTAGASMAGDRRAMLPGARVSSKGRNLWAPPTSKVIPNPWVR